jgi:hypothetical protein
MGVRKVKIHSLIILTLNVVVKANNHPALAELNEVIIKRVENYEWLNDSST